MLISTDGPTKLIFNSQVLLKFIKKYSTGNSRSDTWLIFYEKAKNNNASIIILNICRDWEIEKKKLGSCHANNLVWRCPNLQHVSIQADDLHVLCVTDHWSQTQALPSLLRHPYPLSIHVRSILWPPTGPQPITPRYSWDPPGSILVCRGCDTSLDSSADVNCLISSVISENVGRSEGTSVQHFNISR